MDVIFIFVAGVPVFVVLSVIPAARLGLAASLIVGAGIIAYSFGLAPITGSDPAGNAMSNGYRGILHISAAGGAGVAALYHLTCIYIPRLPEPALNILRYIVFLLLSLPGGMMGAWIVAEALV